MDDVPDHLKFGYAHMMEMRTIEAEQRAAGLSGTELYFACIRHYEARHRGDPSFRQRQEIARVNGEAWVGTPSTPSLDDLLRQALEQIRDGHNDPRSLAREVLDAVNGQSTTMNSLRTRPDRG